MIATATRLAQGAYPGNTMDQVRWLATIGADYGVIAVAANSPINTLPELLEQIKTDPHSISVAGGSAVRMGGGSVGMGAGWTAVAGSGVQIASMVGRLAGAGQGTGGLGLVGALGWGTSMIAGTIQHTKNRTAWDSIGVSQAPAARGFTTQASSTTPG